MTQKRMLAVILCAILVITVTGCGLKSGEGSKDTAVDNTAAVSGEVASETNDPFGAYEEPVTLTVGMSVDPNQTYPEGDSPTDNQYIRYIKEKLNINIKVIWTASTSDYAQKVNLAIASNEIPDALVVNDTQYHSCFRRISWNPLMMLITTTFHQC